MNSYRVRCELSSGPARSADVTAPTPAVAAAWFAARLADAWGAVVLSCEVADERGVVVLASGRKGGAA